MSAVTWGIVSTADINRLVIPGAHASQKVELRGVASRDRARAEAYAREWEIPVAYGSYEELLADPAIEAVYISLPNTHHCEWSVKAVEAGKHVLCEKPLSRHPEEVEAAFDAAERAGRFLSEAFMYRHNPQTKRLRSLVAEGAIGELRLVRSAFSYSLYDADNIRLRTDVEGGALMDVGCYCVSGSRLLGGEPEAVFGAAWFGEIGHRLGLRGDDAVPGRRAGAVRLRHCSAERDELEAIGSEGSLFVDDPWHCRRPVIELRRGRRGRADRARAPSTPTGSSSRICSDAIRGEAELLLGREDAVAQARALEALHNSAETGQPVDL